MKKILIAMDSFKGTFTSIELSVLIKEHLKIEQANYIVTPLSDGGEGFVDAIAHSTKNEEKLLVVEDAFGNRVDSKYIIINKDTAVMEIALSSGLDKIKSENLNPYHTSTYGLGESIIDALNQGDKKIIIGLGGSSTNDGGTGMLRALGVRFFDNLNQEIKRMTGESIARVDKFDISLINPKLDSVEIVVACDVSNPLLGTNGSQLVYSRQKGASEAMVSQLEKNMEKFSNIVVKTLNKDDRMLEGSGAAGGLGFALKTFLNAKICNGFDLLAEMTKLEEKIESVDVVITGEGKFDKQSYYGKAPFKIASLAKIYNKKVYGLFAQAEIEGQVDLFDQIYSIVPDYASEEELLKRPKDILIKFLETIILE